MLELRLVIYRRWFLLQRNINSHYYWPTLSVLTCPLSLSQIFLRLSSVRFFYVFNTVLLIQTIFRGTHRSRFRISELNYGRQRRKRRGVVYIFVLLKGSVGLILSKVSTMWVTIQLTYLRRLSYLSLASFALFVPPLFLLLP